MWIRVYSRKEFNGLYPIIMKEFINKFIQIHSKFQIPFAVHGVCTCDSAQIRRVTKLIPLTYSVFKLPIETALTV